MTYSLGVDLGTTFVAAAVARPAGVEMFTLGDRTVVMPAVVYPGEDGTIITGDAANRRAVSHPDLVGREIKRNLGDPTPLMLSSVPYPVTTLLGALLRDVMQKVIGAEGRPPDRVVLTHPANWGPFRRELFDEVPLAAGVESPLMVPEPAAAAAYYATSRRLDDGEIVAVYDLGGGTFDATIVRKQAGGLEILGTPEGIERLGGVDFDKAILAHVNYAAGGDLSKLDMSDSQTAVALARLRQDCVLAKEALSLDAEVVIPVFLPGRHFEVKLTRSTFEDMVRAPIESTIGALSRTVQSAGLTPADLSSVLLVGGSSRIPLVAEMVSREFGRPTVVDTHPKYAVALGAASIAAASTPALSRPGGALNGMAAMRVDGVRTEAPNDDTVAAGAAGRTADAAAGGVAVEAPPRPPEFAAAGAFVPAPPLNGANPGVGFGGQPPHLRPPPGHSPGAPVGPGRKPRSRIRGVPLAVAIIVAVLGLAIAYLAWPTSTPATVNTAAPPPPPTVAPPPPAPTPTVAPPPPPPVSIAQPTVSGAFPVAQGTAGRGGDAGRQARLGHQHRHERDLGGRPRDERRGREHPDRVRGPPRVRQLHQRTASFAYVSVFDTVGRRSATQWSWCWTPHLAPSSPPSRPRSTPTSWRSARTAARLYVPNHDANLVSVVDTATNTVVNKIEVKPNPHSAQPSPVDGRPRLHRQPRRPTWSR